MISIKPMLKGVIYIVYLFVVTLIGSEIVVRNASNWIPDDLVSYLSTDAMLSVFNERGQIQDEGSPLYHYRPFQKLNWYRHIEIDENGYRNSVPYQTEVDTVLLGDSIVFGRDSRVDFGDLNRAKGVNTLNLAMGGYAPQHYRDVYKKYVIDKGIKHRNVIVNIFVGNDFADATNYPWDIAPKAKGNPYSLWVVNLLFGAFELHSNTYAYNKEVRESEHQVSLPYKQIGIRYLWWTPTPSENQWLEVDTALDEILRLADQVGATVSFVIVPSPASVYGIELHKEFSIYVENHNDIVKRFKAKYEAIRVVDLNSQLAEEIKDKFLYSDDSDCHFNAHGMKVFFNIVSGSLASKEKQ